MQHGPSFSPRGSSSIAAMWSLVSTVALLVADQSAPLHEVGPDIGGDLLDYRTAAVSATVECPQRTDQRSADDCRPDHCPAHLLGTRVHVSLLRASCHPAKEGRCRFGLAHAAQIEAVPCATAVARCPPAPSPYRYPPSPTERRSATPR